MSKHTPSEFGRWLRDARGQAGVTQHELSAASGVHLNTIKHLETGSSQRPSAPVAAKLKATLGSPSTPQASPYDKHTQAGLDLIGAYLMRLPEEERLELILDLTRFLLVHAPQSVGVEPSEAGLSDAR